MSSISRSDQLHFPRVHFHNIGLWNYDTVDNATGWKLSTLASMRRQLGHEKVYVYSYAV